MRDSPVAAIATVRDRVHSPSPQRAMNPPHVEQMLAAMRLGDRDAFNRFVMLHHPLAQKAARSLVRWVGLEREDAEQVAMLGVIEAAKRFKPDRGYPVAAYARYWIRQQCQRVGIDEGCTIRIPTNVFWRSYRMDLRHAALVAAFGPDLTNAQVEDAAADVGIACEQWECYRRTRTLARFSELDRDQRREIRALVDCRADGMSRIIARDQFNAIVRAMADLRERESKIIDARYGLMNEPMTLRQCAESLGITRERVRQIQAGAEEKLRRILYRSQPHLFAVAPASAALG